MRIVSRIAGTTCFFLLLSTGIAVTSAAAQQKRTDIVDQAFSTLGETAGEFDIVDKIDVRKAELIVSQNIALAKHTNLIDEATQSAQIALKVYEQLDNLARSQAQISSVLSDMISEAKLAKDRLGAAGISQDMIAGFLIELLSNKIIETDLTEKQILDISVQINENFAKLEDPRFTLSALYNRARTEKKLGKDIRLFEAVLRISNELIRVEAAKLLGEVDLRKQADEIIEKSIEILKSEHPEKALILAERMVEIHSQPELVHRFLIPFGNSFASSDLYDPAYFASYAEMEPAELADSLERGLRNKSLNSVELIINLVARFDGNEVFSRNLAVGLTRALARENQLDMALFTTFWTSADQMPSGSPRDTMLHEISIILSSQGRGFPALEAAGRIRDRQLRNVALQAASNELAVAGYNVAVETTARKILASLPSGDLQAGDLALLRNLCETLGASGLVNLLEQVKSLTQDGDVALAANRQLLRVAVDRRDGDALQALLSSSAPFAEADRVWAQAYAAALHGDVAAAAADLKRAQYLASEGTDARTTFGNMTAFGSYLRKPDLLQALLTETVSDLLPASQADLLHGFVRAQFEKDPKALAEMEVVSPLLTRIAQDTSLAARVQVTMAKTFAMLGDVENTGQLITMSDGWLDPDQVLQEEITALAMAGRYEEARAETSRIGQHDLAQAALAGVIRIEARLGDVEDSARRLKKIDDYRLRVGTYREIAEWMAHDLDKDGLLSRNHPPAMALVQAENVSAPGDRIAGTEVAPPSFQIDDANTLRAGAGVRLVHQDALLPDYGYPDLIAGLDTTADDVRAIVPLLPRAGPSGLSVAGLNRFARLNRFSSKFFEEVVGMSARDYLYKRQGTINPIFLYLTEGVFTAEKLLYLSVSGRFRTVDRVEDGFIFRAPIVVGPNATLVLSGQEAKAFYLSQSYGSFIVNAGKLFVVDTTLGAYDEDKQDFAFSDYNNRKNFRPFILSWSNSETYIGGSRVVGLGYSAGKSYGLSLSSGPKDSIDEKRKDRRPFGIVADNSFDNMLYGFYSYEADDVAVVGNEYRNNITYGLDPHDRSQRLTLSYNTGYDTEKKHGGIISREVDDSFLVGNLMFDNAGSGLMVDRDSMATTVYANTAFGNEQDGLTYFESPCALIDSNHFFNNKRAGIKARNSWDLSITRNRINGNAEAAIDGYISILEDGEAARTRDFDMDPYIPFGSFFAAGNELRDNNIGIKANGLSAVTLSDNQFLFQREGLYGGDLKEQSLWLLKYGSEGQAVTMASACLPKISHHKGCTLQHRGLLASHATASAFDSSPVTDFCLGDKTSVQAGAVNPVTH
ncbi:right-handed parallel beta-helix repeat-containing protein [Roseibium sp. M-1]